MVVLTALSKKTCRSMHVIIMLISMALCAVVAFPAYHTTSATYCRVRVLIATPDVAKVDVLLNSVQIAVNNTLGDLTPYTSRAAGSFGLRVFPPGVSEPGKAYVTHNVRLEAGNDYTVVVFGKSGDKTLNVAALPDTNTLDLMTARVRFANYVPTSTTLSLAISGATTAGVSAAFGKTSDGYTTVAPTVQGSSAATLSLTDPNGVVVTHATATLSANTVVSAFAIPGIGGTGATLLLNLDAGTAAVPLNAASAPVTASPSAVPAPLPTSGVPPPGSLRSASTTLRAALAPVPQVTDTGTKVWFAATGHTLGGVFKTYWDSHGGLEQFGYPITEEYQEVSATDGKTYTTQYFERARFEDHADKAGTPYEVEQGLLGREMLTLLGAA